MSHAMPEPTPGTMGACWRPIETAPRDGTKVLLFWSDSGRRQRGIEVGYWNDDRNASRKPRPYWQPLVGPS